MPYTAIGYKIKSPVSVLLPAARHLLNTFQARGTFDTVFADAFRTAFTDKRPVRTLDRDDLLMITSDANFGVKSTEYKALAHILYAMLAAGGFGDYRPPVLTYRENPVMTIDEIINEALNTELVLPGPEHYDGEKTTCEIFRASIANTITNICILESRRVHYLDIFRRYMGNLLYTLRTQPQYKVSDQFDRSLLAIMFGESSGIYRTTSIGVSQPTVLTYPIAPDNDPEIGPIMAKIRSVCQTGPWIAYTRMLSTQDPRELAALVCPVVNNLPLATGYVLERGPFDELRLETTENVSWGDKEQFAGYLETVAYPVQNHNMLVTTGYRLPVISRSTGARQVEMIFDFPHLGIELREDPNALPIHQGLRIVYSWVSYIHRRRVSTVTGADMMTFLYDLAAQTGAVGETRHEKLNVDQFDFCDLSDPSVQARRFAYSNGTQSILTEVLYMEGGRLYRRNIDMTLFYNKLGNIGYMPAFVEFMSPSREWFNQPAPNAVEFIIGRLGLNTYDAMASKRLITMSHNIGVYRRLTKRSPRWSFDKYIETITGKSIEPITLPSR